MRGGTRLDKRRRRRLILDLVSRRTLRTQKDLAKALAAAGAEVTQATISRDIREIGLVKVQGPNGLFHYAVPGGAAPDGLREKIAKLVIGVDQSANMLVVRTIPAQAEAAAEAILGLDLDGVLGVFPYKSSVLIVADERGGAKKAMARLGGLLT